MTNVLILVSVTSAFRFLDLPPELRNCIYELVVTEADGINVRNKLPPLSQVCTQMREEVLPIYLDSNTFVIPRARRDIDYLVHWLAAMGPQRLRHLKLLSIDCIGYWTKFYPNTKRFCATFMDLHILIARLAAFGLNASQLRWTWLFGDTPGEVEKCLVMMRQLAEHIHLISTYALHPLLKDHDLLEDKVNPLEILSHIGHNMGNEKKLKRIIEPAVARIREVEETLASDRISPQDAYEEYVKGVFAYGVHWHNLENKNGLLCIHNGSGVAGYRDSSKCITALEHAVHCHRYNIER